MKEEVEASVRTLIDSHRGQAVLVAIERLNRSLDVRDQAAWEFWAEVVHVIHTHQGLSSPQRGPGRIL